MVHSSVVSIWNGLLILYPPGRTQEQLAGQMGDSGIQGFCECFASECAVEQ